MHLNRLELRPAVSAFDYNDPGEELRACTAPEADIGERGLRHRNGGPLCRLCRLSQDRGRRAFAASAHQVLGTDI